MSFDLCIVSQNELKLLIRVFNIANLVIIKEIDKGLVI